MAVKKIKSVCLDEDVIERVRLEKGRYSMSSYINNLLDRNLKPLNELNK